MIVLDTHAWIWFINAPEKLGTHAAAAIEKARREEESLHLSCISAWEIHMLAAKGRLSLGIAPDIWIARCERLSFLRFHPVDNTIARLAVEAEMHPDPADRMIVATALYLGADLATCDAKIRNSGLVSCVW